MAKYLPPTKMCTIHGDGAMIVRAKNATDRNAVRERAAKPGGLNTIDCSNIKECICSEFKEGIGNVKGKLSQHMELVNSARKAGRGSRERHAEWTAKQQKRQKDSFVPLNVFLLPSAKQYFFKYYHPFFLKCKETNAIAAVWLCAQLNLIIQLAVLKVLNQKVAVLSRQHIDSIDIPLIHPDSYWQNTKQNKKPPITPTGTQRTFSDNFKAAS